MKARQLHKLKLDVLNKNEYYHVVVSRAILQTGNKPNYSCETNLTKEHIISDFFIPQKRGKQLFYDGDIFGASEAIRITVYFTTDKIFSWERKHRSEIASFLHNNAKVVTREFLDEVKQIDPEKPDEISQKLTVKDVSVILNNFESAMKRWVWHSKKKWLIDDEYDVQSILFLILRSYFTDLEFEDPNPKFGHSFSKVDFKIPSLKIIVEVKFARDKDHFKKIEREVKVDTVDYIKTTEYRQIIVFIYDDSASVQEHEITARALKRIDGIMDVIITSRPSHILHQK